MAKRRSGVDLNAPIHWMPRDQYLACFNSLDPDDRWINSQSYIPQLRVSNILRYAE
jgi:hypothetical protein